MSKKQSNPPPPPPAPPPIADEKEQPQEPTELQKRVADYKARFAAATNIAAKEYWARRILLTHGIDRQKSRAAKVVVVHKTNRHMRRIEAAKKRKAAKIGKVKTNGGEK